MGVHAYAIDESVDANQDGEQACQDRLHNDEDEAGDGLGGLREAKLLDENQDANDGNDADDLDGNVDPLARRHGVWSQENQEQEHNGLDDQLAGRLDQAVPIGTSNDTALGKHVDDDGHEEPPVASLVVVVEDTVLAPRLLVLEELGGVTLCLFELVRKMVDAPGEAKQDCGKEAESDAGESLCSPRVAFFELVDAVQNPDAVEQEDQVGQGLGKKPPVVLAEAG